MSSPEGSTGELDDMSWLTDDIFAETRGLKPVNAEATGDAVFEQQAQSDDEPSHEDLLASQQAEPDAAQEARDEDFLAALQDEAQEETPADSQLLDAIGDEQAAEPENSEDFIAAMDMLDTSGDVPQAEFDVESRRAGFDEDFLASLDTLDQMQSSGQSHVGDDLFSSWEGENVSPYDEQQIEVTDDFLTSIEVEGSDRKSTRLNSSHVKI